MASAVVALTVKRLIIFFLYSSNLLEERTTFLSQISEINSDILTITDSKIVENLLFGDTFLFNLITLITIIVRFCSKVQENESRALNSYFNSSPVRYCVM